MRTRGFTLVEMLVAFAIVAVAVGVSLEAMSSGLSGARAASSTTSRILLARSMMDAVGVETPLEAGTREGAFPDGERWRVTVSPMARRDGALGLWRVDLVLFGEGRAPLSFVALRHGP